MMETRFALSLRERTLFYGPDAQCVGGPLMIRKSIRTLLAASLAAASLTAIGGSAQAGTPDETSASAQGWCEIVPAVCAQHCGKKNSARCAPVPDGIA